MSMITLSQVWLVTAIGPTRGQALSSLIAGNEFLLEADYHHGHLSDVVAYRNENSGHPDMAPEWKWFVGIPIANVKAYTIAGELPQPASLSGSGKQEASLKAPGPAKAGTAASA